MIQLTESAFRAYAFSSSPIAQSRYGHDKDSLIVRAAEEFRRRKAEFCWEFQRGRKTAFYEKVKKVKADLAAVLV